MVWYRRNATVTRVVGTATAAGNVAGSVVGVAGNVAGAAGSMAGTMAGSVVSGAGTVAGTVLTPLVFDPLRRLQQGQVGHRRPRSTMPSDSGWRWTAWEGTKPPVRFWRAA